MKAALTIIITIACISAHAFCISTFENTLEEADFIFRGRADTTYRFALWQRGEPLAITNFVVYNIYRGNRTNDYVSVISGLEYRYSNGNYHKDSIYLMMVKRVEGTGGLYTPPGCSHGYIFSFCSNDDLQKIGKPIYTSHGADARIDTLKKLYEGVMHIPPTLSELRMQDVQQELTLEKEKNKELRSAVTISGILFFIVIAILFTYLIRNKYLSAGW